jgi:RNA-binding protein
MGCPVSTPLTSKQRQFLKALAHHLEPTVQIGSAGITPGVLEEIGRALEAHELIKVRVGTEAPIRPKEAASPVAAATGSEVAQVIGRVLVVYRRRAKEPKIQLPAGEPKK